MCAYIIFNVDSGNSSLSPDKVSPDKVRVRRKRLVWITVCKIVMRVGYAVEHTP